MKKLVLILISLIFLFTPVLAHAQGSIPCLPGLGGGSGCDPNAGGSGGSTDDKVGKINSGALGVPTDINSIIAGLVQLVYAVAGIVFFFMFIYGGLRYLTAGGDEKAAMAARGTLTNAFIGLIIVVAAFVITQLLFSIFHINGFIRLG